KRVRANRKVSQQQTRILAARRAGSCRRQAQQQVGRTHVHAQLVEQGGGLAAVVGLVVEEVQQQVRQPAPVRLAGHVAVFQDAFRIAGLQGSDPRGDRLVQQLAANPPGVQVRARGFVEAARRRQGGDRPQWLPVPRVV